MDEERRRRERAGAGDDPEALLRAALSHRRTGDLESAREALARAVELAPGHELARALLLVTEVGLGRNVRGSFHAARSQGVELARFLDPAALGAVARAAIDPAHGPLDGGAVDALIGSGREGTKAILEALGAEPSKLGEAIATIGQLKARDIAASGVTPADVPPALRRHLLSALGDERSLGCPLLAGALGISEARPRLEDLLGAENAPPLRNAAALALELLADPRSRLALERAFSRATSAAEKLLLDRALSVLR